MFRGFLFFDKNFNRSSIKENPTHMKKLLTLLLVVMLCAPTTSFAQTNPLKVYPTPVKPGQQVTIQLPDSLMVSGKVIAYREDGYRIGFWQDSYGQKFSLNVPSEFRSGLYPIQIPCSGSPTGYITAMVVVLK